MSQGHINNSPPNKEMTSYSIISSHLFRRGREVDIHSLKTTLLAKTRQYVKACRVIYSILGDFQLNSLGLL